MCMHSVASKRGFHGYPWKKSLRKSSAGPIQGKTDTETLHSVLSKPENPYLARQLCWVMTIEGLETYILTTRATTDIDLLVEALRASPDRMDVDVVIGVKGPVAPEATCEWSDAADCGVRSDLFV